MTGAGYIQSPPDPLIPVRRADVEAPPDADDDPGRPVPFRFVSSDGSDDIVPLTEDEVLAMNSLHEY